MRCHRRHCRLRCKIHVLAADTQHDSVYTNSLKWNNINKTRISTSNNQYHRTHRPTLSYIEKLKAKAKAKMKIKIISYNLCYKHSLIWNRLAQCRSYKCKCKSDYTIESSTRHNLRLRHVSNESKNAKSVKHCMHYNYKRKVNCCNVDWKAEVITTKIVEALKVVLVVIIIIITIRL